MQVIFDDSVSVHYGFVHVTPASGEPTVDPDDARAGQRNGLLGVGVAGCLSLTTGTHTGGVPLLIEWHEGEPSDDPMWEDVVEASLTVVENEMTLSTFDEYYDVTIPAQGDVRVRFCATALDAAHDAADPDDLIEEEYLGVVVPDRYLLQLWPSPVEPDRIVRTGSDVARYWHGVARDLVPLTPEQRRARDRELEASYECDEEAATWVEPTDYPAMSKDHGSPAVEGPASTSVVPDDDEGDFGWYADRDRT